MALPNKLAWVEGERQIIATEAMEAGKFYHDGGDPVFVDGVQDFAIGDLAGVVDCGTFRCNCVNTDAYDQYADVYYLASNDTCYPATGAGRIWIGTAARAKANGGGTELLVMLGKRNPFLQGTQQTLAAGGGAVNVTSYYTAGASDAGGDAWTLADGLYRGQIKKIQLITDGGGDAVLTPTNLNGGTTITFADAGDYAVLMWDGAGWDVIELGNDADGATAPVLA